MEFPEERVSAFSIIRSNKDGYLQEIIEKPSEEIIKRIYNEDGRIEVSMNAFVVLAEQLIPYLVQTPFHTIRNEKDLPTAISLMAKSVYNSFYVIPLSENVPDLTSKHDLSIAQDYLNRYFSF